MRVRRFFLSLFVAAIASVTRAQEIELANIAYSLSPIHTPQSTEYIQQTNLKLRYPVRVREKNKVLIGVSGEAWWLNHRVGDDLQSVYGISFPLAWQHQLTRSLSLTVLLTPGIFSDMKDLSTEDFRLSSAIRFKRVVSKRLSLGWGVGYARQFFGNVVMPFGEVDWRMNDKLTLSGLFPIKPKLEYRLKPGLTIGTQVTVDNTSMRLSARQHDSHVVQYRQWNAELYTDWRLYRQLYVTLTGGYVVRRKIQVLESDTRIPWTVFTIPISGEKNAIRSVSGNGLLIQAGLSWKWKQT
jgi:hypothetical protein